MATPLFDALKSYSNLNMVRTHTPGHSGKSPVLDCFGKMLMFDATEIPMLDSLYHANGVIQKAEDLATSFFHTKRTLMSAGGCTLAIQTMIALALSEGDTLLAARNVHVSVLNACALLNINVRFVYPDFNDGLRIQPEKVKEALSKYPDIKAVLITSPNYYGTISDIKTISSLCNDFNIPLLVDNAHGTHLVFYNMHPIQMGATMSACSAHKTLPALTGGAWLNINDERFVPYAKQKMSLFGSTSPSYPIMASLDLCREYCQTSGEDDFKKLRQNVNQLYNIAKAVGVEPISGMTDPARLTLDTRSNGRKTAEILRMNGVEVEMFDNRYVVMILTPFHDEADFDKIRKAIVKCSPTEAVQKAVEYEELEQVLTLRQAMFSETKVVSVDNLTGRIAANTVTLCPPGVPIVVPGERISANTAKMIKNSGILSTLVIK